MATLVAKKSADGSLRWKAIVRIPGHPIRAKTFPRKTDAQRWSDRTEVEIRGGRRIAPDRDERRTVADLIDRFLAGPVAQLEKEAARGIVGAQRLRDKAVTRRRHLGWWRREIGPIRLVELRAGDIAAARDQLAGLRTPATVNRYLTSLSVAFKVGQRVGVDARIADPAGRPQEGTSRLWAAAHS